MLAFVCVYCHDQFDLTFFINIMRIHLHTFIFNSAHTEEDNNTILLNNVRQSFWDYYTGYGISQPLGSVRNEQALHHASSDDDIFALTKTYLLSEFHQVMQSLHKMSIDLHEVFIGDDAGLAMVETYVPCSNVYINWVGNYLPNHWRSLSVHRWITSSLYLSARPPAASYFNQVQHIGLAYSPAPNNFILSLPSPDQPRLANQNTILFVLAETNRPDGLHPGSVQMISRIILKTLDFTHVSIASLDTMVSDNQLYHVAVDASGTLNLSADNTACVPIGFHGLFTNDAPRESAHPNTFDTFIRNTHCFLVVSAASLEDLSKLLSISLIINQRHRIYVVLTEELSLKAQRYIYALHQQGYFNLVDLNRRFNQVSLLAKDVDQPLKKSINSELYTTLRKNGVTYPSLGMHVSALSMYRKLSQSYSKVAPLLPCHGKD